MLENTLIENFLKALVHVEGSDLYLTVGAAPTIRMKQGNIAPIKFRKLTLEDINTCIDELLNEDQLDEFHSTLEFNMSLNLEENARFRINIFKQLQNPGMVIRQIVTDIPTIEGLGMPKIFSEIIMQKNGLILMASPTGSGKSTSMAAMIDHRNSFGNGHILTIEDPIEFIHDHKGCIITQREVGVDTYSYSIALRNALRQRADVIVMGEIRDREGMEHAFRFAQAGHLCISTMHASNTVEALDRITNLFPIDSHDHILATLSQSLLCIVSQKLIPNNKEGLSLCCEILKNEGLMKNLITDDRLDEIRAFIARSNSVGMFTFDQSLFSLYRDGMISYDRAISEATSSSTLKLMINEAGISPDMIKKDEEESIQNSDYHNPSQF